MFVFLSVAKIVKFTFYVLSSPHLAPEPGIFEYLGPVVHLIKYINLSLTTTELIMALKILQDEHEKIRKDLEKELVKARD